MSQLRSMVTEMTSFDPDVLSAEELAAEIGEALHGIQLFETAVARWVKSLADRGGHEELGYPSPTALLKHQGGLSAGHTREVVARANATVKAPHVFAAWADGRLSTDQTRHLFVLAETVPDVYPEAEATLVEIVEGLSVEDTARACEYWRQSVDGPGESDTETSFARRGVSVSKTMSGMRRVDGWLTATAGETLQTVLDTLMPPPGVDDTRSPRQRRHDALEDLCRDWLDHSDTPTVGGEKPHLMILTDLPALGGVAGGCHQTLDGDIIDITTLRMLACDCSISRIILGPDSEVLDAGRKTRVWSPAQRRAITARDRHCQAQGCDRGPRWCDIHHLDHWADHGPTNIDKGILLCRWHHTKEHIKLALQQQQQTRRTKG